MSSFKEDVYSVVSSIPEGSFMTYKQVAERIGRPRSYRAVGTALSKNFDPAIPCHRVIRSDGRTGGYNRGPQAKSDLLRKEGAILAA
jgi:O-6-methylguanine DNA methyltransferase